MRIALLDKVDPQIVKEISDALEEELKAVGGPLEKRLEGQKRQLKSFPMPEGNLRMSFLQRLRMKIQP